jgi:glycerol-3-phosphate acyltransferase PlsX
LSTSEPTRRIRVALDMMGGDSAPETIVDGALCAARELADVTVVLVGPPEVADRLRAGYAGAELLDVAPASETIGMGEDPVQAVRSKRFASVRVAARLVHDGSADAFVSAGSTGASVAAALLTLGRLPGMSRAALAVVVPAAESPVVLLDAGASPDADVEVLAQLAVAGSAYASIRLGIAMPRVGLLSIGEEAGKGDRLRKRAYDVLAKLPDIDFVGNVEGGDVTGGGRADVVVTDGFTGNVLLKGMEGAVAMATAALGSAIGADPDLRHAAELLAPAFEQAAASIDPDQHGGALLVGVKGVVVVAHGSSSARSIASSVAVAADAVRSGVVEAVSKATARSFVGRG